MDAFVLALPLPGSDLPLWVERRSLTASMAVGGNFEAVDASNAPVCVAPDTDPDDGRVDGDARDSDDCEGEDE